MAATKIKHLVMTRSKVAPVQTPATREGRTKNSSIKRKVGRATRQWLSYKAMEVAWMSEYCEAIRSCRGSECCREKSHKPVESSAEVTLKSVEQSSCSYVSYV
jgi:hypothetical protein